MKPALQSHRILLRTAAIAACLATLSGCSTVRGWFDRDDKAGEPVALTDFAASASPVQIWSTNVGKGEGRLGLRQGPVVADGRVYAAAVDGGVRALDLQTGGQLWHYPTDVRISGGPGAGEGLVVAGGLDGEVIALDAATGTQRWEAKVSNEVIAPPVIGQGMVFVRSNDGRVTAFDATSGQRRWFWNHDVPPLSVRGNDGVLLGPGYVFVGNDDGTLSALSATDGAPLWEQVVGGQEGRTELDRMADVDGAPVLDGAAIYASSFQQQTIAIDGPTGRPMWASQHGGAGRIGLGPDRLVVSAPDGTVYALDKAGGSALWQQPGLARRNLTAPAVQGSYAVVGDFDGYLHWLDLQDGSFAARTRLSGKALRAAPVVVDGILLAQDTDGRLSAYRLGQ
ncbi:outer membrane protein assembly factor BamB [Lysobacter sp. A3-1-A15]|uniref:outer membrane protein assembly factor BamB n=1 Tax=Novilysobacter viscosus TaxID=3098602 RepID=UPI002ED95576